ncbi:MAG: hypothetical protein JO269_02085 [Burkholderiaceae bacterium]|nr:hypothetical protein [Burkholderiaceae bacterium]
MNMKPTVVAASLTMTLLAVFSTQACAQSEEYRRGYDQGYRDGAEAASQHDRGPRIVIEEAHYGSREGGGFCEARESIQREVGWRRHADIHVGNELCGDPAQGFHKHLEVRYRCSDSQPARAEAPEDSVLDLHCD